MPYSRQSAATVRTRLDPLGVRLVHPLFGPVVAPITVFEHPNYSGSRFKQSRDGAGEFSMYFEAGVDSLDFADAFLETRRRKDATFDIRPELWHGLRATYAEVPFGMNYSDEKLILARVQVTEVPYAHVMAAAGSWTAYVSRYYGEDFAEAVDRLRAMDDGGRTIAKPLASTGSLLSAMLLRVHPLVRRQHLATRLLHHIFWRFTRTSEDLFVDALHPVSSPDQKRAQRTTIAQLEALVAFAQAAGLHRVDDAPLDRARPPFVYRQIGLFDLPKPSRRLG